MELRVQEISVDTNGGESDSSHQTGRDIARVFTEDDRSVYDAFEWEKRDCTLCDEHGSPLFVQEGVLVPATWSEMASLIVASKYLHGEPGTPDREEGVRTLIARVVDTIGSWGEGSRYFSSETAARAFRDELAFILLDQRAAFNSPVWFNVGIREQPQTSACFIVSVEDELEDLSALQALETRLFKFGSGIGTNFSSVRAGRERLRGGGAASGPVSFMRALDAWAGIIKSGGKTRRAAKMMILNADHPDILEFITCKSAEERKAHALIESGYDGGFGIKGEAYDSVAFQNANLSVRVDDEFMRAVESDALYETKWVVSGETAEKLKARDVFRAIAEATWFCGDPGLQFDTTINAWHTCPNSGRINGSNPCSEYMSIDNSACNLASVNLLKFLQSDNSFDVSSFLHTVDLLITAQDILIDKSGYPDEAIGRTARDFRQLGLGYTNLGAILMSIGVPYDSGEGRAYAAAITALMTGQAYLTSARLAVSKGAFKAFRKNRTAMLSVIRKHRDAAHALGGSSAVSSLEEDARAVWDAAIKLGTEYGFRNSQVSVLAPTGTISFMMDCDTTGIEPDIALIKYKKLAGGGMLKIVNKSVERGLTSLGYARETIETIVAYVEEHGSVAGAPGIRGEHLPVFDCALASKPGGRVVSYMGHLEMMAAVQPFLSGAISKTVNLPDTVSVDEILEVYLTAWRKGIKAVALYRDGSKRTQPLTTSHGDASTQNKTAQNEERTVVRRRLPEERNSITHRFRVGTLEGYLTVGLFEDGSPGEIFLVVAKEGSTLSGVMDAFATAISLALQYGVPLSSLIKKFSHMRFEPAGFTGSKEVPLATSVIDYVFRWLALRFLSAKERRGIGVLLPIDSGETAPHVSQAGAAIKDWQPTFEDAPPCTACGSSLMIRQGACYACLNCGAQGGCS